jgi:hypothetical protein
MISVILNVYKRPYSLEKQIEAILNQTVEIKPENIHVWMNKAEGVDRVLPKNKGVKSYVCTWNTKYFGRFMIPLITKTDFVTVFDDDIIPGNRWFENCLNVSNQENAILGASGVLLHSDQYMPNSKVGWNGTKSDKAEEVDLVGHCWFFRKEHAKFMWLEEPPSWDNGEDMFFSYVAQKNGVKTMVPPHPKKQVEMWGNVPSRDEGMGSDQAASWIHNPDHYKQRNEIANKLINNGWKTVRSKKQ